MVTSANISNKSIDPQEGSKETKKTFFSLFARIPTQTQPWLIILQNGLHHLVPHMILILVIYWLSIFLKWGTHVEDRI